MVSIDRNKCSSCGLCVKECCNGVFNFEDGCTPNVGIGAHCIGCGRCVAKCSNDALNVDGVDIDKMRDSAPENLIRKDDLKLFIESKRSWRQYKEEPLKKEELHELLEIAQIAPTAMNSQDKTFIVIQDKEKIDEIRQSIIKASRKLLRLMKVLSSAPIKYLFPKETREYFIWVKHDFGSLIEAHDKGFDSLFYGAPCIVLFTGVGADIMGKDNALFAMGNFMVLAETMGIGTCINGFTSANPKILAKLVDVPRFHKVFGVLTVGYKKGRFNKTIYRKEPVVNWI